MRVIAGIHKGRRLAAPETPATRPVADRVKEAVFSSLGDSVVGARVLDLYAGAGSFGIEAVSRGAESVVFVESAKAALNALRANLANIGIEAVVDSRPVESYVATLDAEFDLVFADPPWPMDSGALGELLDKLAPHLDDGAVAVVSRRSSDRVPAPDSLAIDTERRYGDTRIIRYRKAP